MKADIQNREDITRLINDFYAKVRRDEVIGSIFDEVIGSDWDKHLPVMYNFWEDLLFQTHQYSGNPMIIHQQLHQRIPLLPAHFERWEKLFLETVHELFEGEKASLATQRAISIATMMQVKLAVNTPYKPAG